MVFHKLFFISNLKDICNQNRKGCPEAQTWVECWPRKVPALKQKPCVSLGTWTVNHVRMPKEPNTYVHVLRWLHQPQRRFQNVSFLETYRRRLQIRSFPNQLFQVLGLTHVSALRIFFTPKYYTLVFPKPKHARFNGHNHTKRVFIHIICEKPDKIP